MTDAHEEEAARAAAAFRPNSRPLLVAVLANVLLAALCLGVPYARGHAQTEDSLRAFARFTGCLLGGKAQTQQGLALPPGERAHFAALVMNGPLDWPSRCRASLRAVAPEEAIFLWPSVKQAGADVRAAVTLLDRELLALARARQAGATGRVPTRPLLALAKLQGALTLLARAGDADGALDTSAVVLEARADVIDPTRLPLVAGASAALEVWPSPDGLEALAADGGGISWLRVEGGEVERLRVRRTSLVRAALRAGETPLLVWAMPDSRCEERDDRCVRRGTGVAYLAPDAVQLPRPTWLAGHPGARADRSLRIGLNGRIDLLARNTAEGALEVRRFELPPAEPALPAAPGEDAAPPLPAIERREVPAPLPPLDALLLQGTPPAVAYAVTAPKSEPTTAPAAATAAAASAPADVAEPRMQAWLWPYESGTEPTPLGSARGGGAWVDACEADGTRWVAFGTERELALARLPAQGEASTPLSPIAVDLGPLLPRDEARRDRVRILCTTERATVIALDRESGLHAVRCEPATCTRGPLLARAISGFDAALTADGTAVVAYARKDQPQVTVVRLDAHGAPLGPAQVPAPCWDPQGGMCGQPTLVAAPSGLLLCARDGSDLVALESPDGGKHWRALGGLQVRTAISNDASAPMQQHRIRKGLD